MLYIYRNVFNININKTKLFDLCLNNKIIRNNIKYFHNSYIKYNLSKELYNKLPQDYQTYANLIRLDKPIGTLLLLLPCTWGVAIASPSITTMLLLISKFGIGAFLMRGAGCIINDMWDRDIDRQVKRTINRPLASGSLTFNQGLLALGVHLSLAASLLFTFKYSTIFIALYSIPLVIMYPYMKRITHWPQLFLGLTFNWGVFVGYMEIMEYIDWAIILPLYIGGICWTIVYDTIYAYQDVNDDKKVGVKSTALYFGNNASKWLSLFSCISVSCFTIAGLNANLSAPFFIIGIGGVSLHYLWQILTLKLSNHQDCGRKFVNNKYLGLLLFIGILMGSKTLFNDQEMNGYSQK